jgi:MYXO-CTERM domain-containing protein
MNARHLLPRLPSGAGLALGLAGLAAAGCGPTTELVELQPAQLEVNTRTVEYGLVPRGERLDKEIVLSNTGDVDLGISEIYLASERNEDRGHEGSFRIFWDCGDLQVPNLDTDTPDEADETARERPSFDTASDTAVDDTSIIDTGEGGGGTGGRDTDPCTMPAGSRLAVRVRFQPQRAGGNWDSLIIETEGDELSDEERRALAVDEIVYADLDNAWRQIFLNGIGGETEPRPLITPQALDFGYVFPGQDQNGYVTIRNDGDGVLATGEIGIDQNNCVDGFEIISAPDPNEEISGSQAKVVHVRYTPADDREARCRFNIETYNPENPEDTLLETDVLMVANAGRNPANEAPRVIIHSPPPGYQHKGMDPLPVEITVFDPNEPVSGIYCKIRTALQGLQDNRPALADCRPAEGNPSGHMIVPVPVDFYVQPGLDVLLVRATDSSGVTREASVPVLYNAPYPESDDDGDGFGREGEWVDCDDTNPNVHPLAAEAFDGRDNDCDRLIDEGTDGFDDDGDGMTEAQGDCNDADPASYLGGPELRDEADNDCDGLVDENTAAFDDDGDGYTELEQDCDDADPTINPGADELCGDNIDNDCDGIADVNDLGGCVATDTAPMIVGRIDLSRTSIEVGEAVAMFAQVYEEDGDDLTYEWSVKDDLGSIDDPRSPTPNWNAPPELSNPDLIAEPITISVAAIDDDGNQDWVFEQVLVFPESDLDVALVKEVEVERGSACSTAPAAPVGVLLGLGLVVAGFRRRRDHA